MSFRDEYYIQRDRRAADVASVSSSSSSRSRTPGFLMRGRDDTRGGEMVLRSRKVEQGYSRHRSPSPVRYEEKRLVRVARSVSPSRERARSRSRPPAEQRVRLIGRERSVSPEGRVRIMNRGRSSSADRFRARIDVTESCRKDRSPSPEPPKVIKGPVIERDVVTHWTDIDHRKRAPSPPPMPKKIQGPTIEREVITHWRDVDHGVIRARSPSSVRRTACETDIDIDVDINHRHRRHRSHHHTDIDVDVHHSQSPARRARSRSRSHVRHKSVERRAPAHFHDDTEIVVRTDRERLRVEEEDGRRKHRSHSAIPLRSSSPSYSEEADYITSRIDARGRMGEAWNGHTRDWTIVDVPPGTERVRMDGVGGGSAELNWSRYSGVRRSKFIPERDLEPTSNALVVADSSDRERDTKLSVQIYDKDSRERSRTSSEMWTEITKDLVCKEAIERMGYEYEETEWFYYIMEYLKYEDVLEIVNLSDRIRDSRRRRAREIEWEREYLDVRGGRDHTHEIDITATHRHSHSHSHSRPRHRSRRYDEFDARERDLYVDRRALY